MIDWPPLDWLAAQFPVWAAQTDGSGWRGAPATLIGATMWVAPSRSGGEVLFTSRTVANFPRFLGGVPDETEGRP